MPSVTSISGKPLIGPAVKGQAKEQLSDPSESCADGLGPRDRCSDLGTGIRH